ncbi:MAG: LPS export ABC transporter periplasmic protein LptC [Alphaproteobacteria bacterium]|nr:LPS export ABC transporter periplasmic protein LptC [Alphaproteobacteria bacterium]
MTAASEIGDKKPPQRLRHLTARAAPSHFSRSHSYVVRFCKIVLPLIAVAMLATAFMWPGFRDRMASFAGFIPAAINAATDDYQVLRMSIRGVDNEDRPFTFTADTAIKYDPDIEEIELLRPSADFELENGSWLAVMADRGHYLKERKALLMQDNVNMFHDEGYEMNTSAAVFSLENSEANSDQPTHGHGEFGEFDAQGGFRILSDGDRILLKGPAKIVIYPDHEDSQ